jgi:3-oxoacyl-[acyl-carrier protein] reductase
VDLNGAVAIVTGAGRGIGKEIALSIARAGAKAVVITDISDAIFTVAKQIETEKAEALPLKCDVTKLEQVENVASKTLEKYGKIDLLVNNAGIYPLKSFLEMTNDDWNKVIDVNLNGVFHYTKAVLPAMVKQKHGKIVNIGSIAGAVVAFSSLAHYSASKAAIAGFTKSLAFEVAQYGINVNAVAPGPTDVSEGDPAYQAMYAQVVKTIPLGRIGKPVDIANLVVFLASEKASFITGQCIVCDGGYTLP